MKKFNIITIIALISLIFCNSFMNKSEYVIVKSENNDILTEYVSQKAQNSKKDFENIDGMFIVKKKKKMNTKDIFLHRLGKRESGLNYDRANRYYYVGKYQFGRQALRDIGYTKSKINKIMRSLYLDTTDNRWKINIDYFTPEEQEKAMERYMYNYENKYLGKVIDRYENKYYTTYKKETFYMTRSSILAAAHLGGAGSVKRYFRSNGRYNPKDAFGTSIQDYMKMFSDLEMVDRFEYKSL